MACVIWGQLHKGLLSPLWHLKWQFMGTVEKRANDIEKDLWYNVG